MHRVTINRLHAASMGKHGMGYGIGIGYRPIAPHTALHKV